MPTDANASQFSTGQLKALLAPYALYPDPLLALILPASAVPITPAPASASGISPVIVRFRSLAV